MIQADERVMLRRSGSYDRIVDGFGIEEIVARVAARPQHLLVTLLGDFWLERREALPSTTLVRLLAAFGVTEPNARAALSRLARKDLLVAVRRGRRTAYALSQRGLQTLREGTERIFGFCTGGQAWDGQWTVVTFSVPEQNRSVRGALRTRLRWLGFAVREDATWIAPGDLRVPAGRLVEELGVPTSTIVYGEVWGQSGPEVVAQTWRLDEVELRYRSFLAEFGSVAGRVTNGDLSLGEAFVLRTVLMDEWRTFPAVDPELPMELLPADWPAPAGRALFERIYDVLGPWAEQECRRLVAVDDSELAKLASVHSSTEAINTRHYD
jgi:phenylacetic acid degradation operon negative regulatory protein